MRKFILCLMLLMVMAPTSRANAELKKEMAREQDDSATLITFEEFKSMNVDAQDRYVTGLRGLFRDWASYQEKEEKLKYQSVEISKPKAFALFALLFDDARAGAGLDTRPCAYVGYISDRKDGTGVCMSRERCPSTSPAKRGWVRCNPLVYGPGDNVCAPPGNGGTAYCGSHAASDADTRAYILAHPREFNALRTELQTVCPRSSNPSICGLVRNRVTQMYDQVKTQLPRGSSPPGPVTVERPRVARPTGDQAGGANPSDTDAPVAPRDAGRVTTASIDNRVPPPLPQPVVLPAEARARESANEPIVVTGRRDVSRPTGACEPYSTACIPSALMQPMNGPQDNGWAGKTLMTLQEAQGLYCSTDPINPAFIDSVKRFIRQQQSRTTGMKRADRNYYSCHYKQMEDNFNACVALAQSNRAANRVPSNGGPLSAVLTQRGNVIDMQVTGADVTYNTTTVEPYLGLMFGMRYRMEDERLPDGRTFRTVKTEAGATGATGYEIDLCKVRMIGATVGNSASPNSPNAPPAPPTVGGSGGH